MSELNICFGVLAPSLVDQLAPLGLSLPDGDSERLQFYADSIARLMIAGLATDSEAHRMRKRLMKLLAKKVTQ